MRQGDEGQQRKKNGKKKTRVELEYFQMVIFWIYFILPVVIVRRQTNTVCLERPFLCLFAGYFSQKV